jgi:hypothetical protein
MAKPSQARWHSRLGHPTLQIVQHVLSRNKLLVSSELSNLEVCDACQIGKAQQLPYPKSFSVSTAPLELVFSNVWGHAPESIGRKKYYVSFINDFSKFVCFDTLKHNLEAFVQFQEFQNLVERLLNRKILAIQTDWGGEY